MSDIEAQQVVEAETIVEQEPAPDLRPRVARTKTINPVQLDGELGGGVLTWSDDEIKVADPDASGITLEQLQKAVDAHVAVFPPTRDEQVDKAIEAAKNGDFDALAMLLKAPA